MDKGIYGRHKGTEMTLMSFRGKIFSWRQEKVPQKIVVDTFDKFGRKRGEIKMVLLLLKKVSEPFFPMIIFNFIKLELFKEEEKIGLFTDINKDMP